jgi:hypothetical protein
MHDDDQDDVLDIDDALVEDKEDEDIPAGFTEVDPITGLPVPVDDVSVDENEEEDTF